MKFVGYNGAEIIITIIDSIINNEGLPFCAGILVLPPEAYDSE